MIGGINSSGGSMAQMQQMKGMQGMGQNPMRAMAAYQTNPDQDPASMLLDMLNGDEEDQEEYIPLDTQA